MPWYRQTRRVSRGWCMNIPDEWNQTRHNICLLFLSSHHLRTSFCCTYIDVSMQLWGIRTQQAGLADWFFIVANPKHFLLSSELYHAVHLGLPCCNPLDNSYCSPSPWEGAILPHSQSCWWWFTASCSERPFMVAKRRIRARPSAVLVKWGRIRPYAWHLDWGNSPRSCASLHPAVDSAIENSPGLVQASSGFNANLGQNGMGAPALYVLWHTQSGRRKQLTETVTKSAQLPARRRN